MCSACTVVFCCYSQALAVVWSSLVGISIVELSSRWRVGLVVVEFVGWILESFLLHLDEVFLVIVLLRWDHNVLVSRRALAADDQSDQNAKHDDESSTRQSDDSGESSGSFVAAVVCDHGGRLRSGHNANLFLL